MPTSPTRRPRHVPTWPIGYPMAGRALPRNVRVSSSGLVVDPSDKGSS